MENEQTIEGDASVIARSKLPPFRRSLSQNSLDSAAGTLESSAYEQTPLLARDAGHYEGNGKGSPEISEDRDGRDWSGAKDIDAWRLRAHFLKAFWILPPFVLSALAFGGTMVPKINIIQALICRQYAAKLCAEDPTFQFLPVILGENNTPCDHIPEVSSMVAKFTLYGTLISGVLAAFTSAKLGQVSDQYGRTKLMAFTSSGMLVTDVVTILAAKLPDKVPINWILVSYVFDGLSGSFITALALVHAYATDCTPPARRSVVFGYFHGSMFTGIALGPLVSAYIVKASKDLVLPFYIATAVHALYFIAMIFIIPESLTMERQMAAREKARFTGADHYGSRMAKFRSHIKAYNLLAPLKTLWPTGENSNRAARRNLVLLAAVDTTVFGVYMGTYSIIVIYTTYKFSWGNFETSRYVSIVNVCRVANLTLILPLLSRLLRGPRDPTREGRSGSDKVDLYVIRGAILCDILGYIGYSLAGVGTVFVLCGAATSFGSLASPTLQSALTKHVPPEKTGAVLGAMGLLHALARVVAPVIFNGIYSATVGKYDRAVFFCLAATFGLSVVLSCFIKPYVHWEEPDPPSRPNTQESSRGLEAEIVR
ncbi:MAG: hypothetical protein LQ351_002247 [Letrouitia transgressa]|nr:MAG: hypothetical protein LQ351_002247 [Letrouitia transgressa]